LRSPVTEAFQVEGLDGATVAVGVGAAVRAAAVVAQAVGGEEEQEQEEMGVTRGIVRRRCQVAVVMSSVVSG
jgi:hypothetical protein